MEINLTNTLGNKKEVFVPQQKGKVSMYHCGPTVYNNVHIGNLRAFVFADTLRRIFEYNGYEVNQAMNITDVDDKTIRGSVEAGISLAEFTRKYTGLFLSEIDQLNILEPKSLPRATDHIHDMIELIQKLLDSEHAYKTEDGIYFSIQSFKEYGKLSHAEKRTETKSRIARDEYSKDDASDFALWKFHTVADGEIAWGAAFGKGRPGWHIECSAMSINALGNTLDIHTGGTDLIFPHHENEIAQSEAATGEHFVNYWLHSAFLMVGGKKMSKSEGNFITLSTIIEKKVSPLAFRYWLLTGHYSTLMNFTWEALEAAQFGYDRLLKAYARAAHRVEKDDKADQKKDKDSIKLYEDKFLFDINDDLNTPQAIALMWNMIKDNELADASKAALIEKFDAALGLDIVKQSKRFNMTHDTDLPADIKKLADERAAARHEKNWSKSDELRKAIEDAGYTITDIAGEQNLTPSV